MSHGWQPIATAPKDRPILSKWNDCGGGSCRIVVWSLQSNAFLTIPGRWAFNPTHWREIPA